jgi:hypothetical protein
VRADLDGPVCGVFNQQRASAPPAVEHMRACVDQDFAGDHGLFLTTRTPNQGGDREAKHEAQQIGGMPMATFHAMALMGQRQAVGG